MKELAKQLLAARSALLNAENETTRARGAYIKAEREYLDGMGDQHRTIVVDNCAIGLSSSYPDSRTGSHLDFESVEVLS